MCAGKRSNERIEHEDDVRGYIKIIKENLRACKSGGIGTRGVWIIKGVR